MSAGSRHRFRNDHMVRLAGLVMLCVAGAAPAQDAPFLVKDINARAEVVSSSPGEFVTIGASTYFTAATVAEGRELWKTDGTAAGTVLVRDVVPGFAGADPHDLVDLNGTLLFAAHTAEAGHALWRSDGTASGTMLVQTLEPTPSATVRALAVIDGALLLSAQIGCGQMQLWRSDGSAAGTTRLWQQQSSDPCPRLTGWVLSGGVLYFRISGYGHGIGQQLWRSNGTAAGTFLVRQLSPGVDISITTIESAMVDRDGTLFFIAGSTGFAQLWTSDGTEPGTMAITSPELPRGGLGARIFSGDDDVLFFATDENDATNLWRTDGTSTGTVPLIPLRPPRDITFTTAVSNGGTLFFPAADAEHGIELWRTDGSAAGTRVVTDLNPDSGDASPQELTAIGDTVYFVADDGVHGNELWVTDGSAAGTRIVADIWSGADGAAPAGLARIGDRLYFNADDGIHGRELWLSDGSAAGTMLVSNIAGEGAVSQSSVPDSLTSRDGRVLFTADDGIHGTELWASDGTEAGTTLLRDIAPGPTSSAEPTFFGLKFAPYDGRFYFNADDGLHGNELWITDGTREGTVLLKDIAAGAANAESFVLGPVGGSLLLSADDGVHGRELWRTDGTEAGTVLLRDLNDAPTASYPFRLTQVNDTSFFTANPSLHGGQLWTTDGTTAGTVMLKFFPGFFQVDPVIALDDWLLFAADDGVLGHELWRSDGTASGTVLVQDINAGAASASIAELTPMNGAAFFRADDGVRGKGLWRSDGTGAGTTLVKSFGAFDRDDFSPFALQNIDGTLFFVTSRGFGGTLLWKSDGTAEGTVLLREIGGGTLPPPTLTSIRGIQLFVGEDAAHGRELWRTDGTPAGTRLLTDIVPGPPDSSPSFLTVVDDVLLFRAVDPPESALWVTDGTESGTRKLAHIVDPGAFAAAGATVLFAANERLSGRELWGVGIEDVVSCPQNCPPPSATLPPASDLPDVLITRVNLVNRDGAACTTGDERLLVNVCVANLGAGAAGLFSIALNGQAWIQVSGLDAFSERCIEEPPNRDLFWHLTVDADGAITEANEGNNDFSLPPMSATESACTPTPTVSPTPTPTTRCPPATREPFWVDSPTSPTTELSQAIRVYLGNGERVEIVTESGTFTRQFSGGGTDVVVALLPNTVHHLHVTGFVREVEAQNGCTYGGYSLSTTVDRDKNELIIRQQTLDSPSRTNSTGGCDISASPTNDLAWLCLVPGLSIWRRRNLTANHARAAVARRKRSSTQRR